MIDKNLFERKLRAAIQKHLDADTKHSKSGTLGQITKLINAAVAVEKTLAVEAIETIKSVLAEFEGLPDRLTLRFQKGSLYQGEHTRGGGLVFGWYSENQIEALPLPVIFDDIILPDGGNRKYIRVVSGEMRSHGFLPAVDLPFYGSYVYTYPTDENFFELLKAGWASPCPIQWSWLDRPSWVNLEGYVVERSIIPYGFWVAWKWWPDCWQWYIEKRPELFDDAEFWHKEPTRYEPPAGDRYAAVLGSASKNREVFHLDD
ncbi:hypothetical protein QUA41_31040 [Microcoleus sp. Pol11C1]|uniref:hypothetical protein n=1 Tax=unclassified Microcoleus TaxID=2642155 RepID=UPI002FD77ACC